MRLESFLLSRCWPASFISSWWLWLLSLYFLYLVNPSPTHPMHSPWLPTRVTLQIQMGLVLFQLDTSSMRHQEEYHQLLAILTFKMNFFALRTLWSRYWCMSYTQWRIHRMRYALEMGIRWKVHLFRNPSSKIMIA